MASRSQRRIPPATLSPAAECWWERIGDCFYLVLRCSGVGPEPARKRHVFLTDTEACVLRELLNDPQWWSDKAQLENQMKGANSNGRYARF